MSHGACRRSVLDAAAVGVIVAGAAGCAIGGGSDVVVEQRGGPVRHSPSPGPVRTILRHGQVLRIGAAGEVAAQKGVGLRMKAAHPTSSRSRLSSSYGAGPAHGYYVTVRLTVTNVGRRPVMIRPQDFVLHVPHQGTVTSYDGNAPYSGAPVQLDATELAPGQRVHAPLTFDVRTPHGRLSYVPDRSAAVSWTF